MAPEKLGPFVHGVWPRAGGPLALLRNAFDATVADPAFLAMPRRFACTVTPMTGEEVARDVDALYATPADLVRKAKAIAGE